MIFAGKQLEMAGRYGVQNPRATAMILLSGSLIDCLYILSLIRISSFTALHSTAGGIYCQQCQDVMF